MSTRLPANYGNAVSELRKPMRLEIAVGWGIIIACCALLLACGAALATVLLRPEPIVVDTDWPLRVRAVCEQYAQLDLSGLAPLCVDAGYQQTSAGWIYVPGQTVMPEDLDRTGAPG